ncbi:hypothetical protein [Pseudomonas phage vB_Pa-PAC2]
MLQSIFVERKLIKRALSPFYLSTHTFSTKILFYAIMSLL